jgi:hypothetical protein
MLAFILFYALFAMAVAEQDHPGAQAPADRGLHRPRLDLDRSPHALGSLDGEADKPSRPEAFDDLPVPPQSGSTCTPMRPLPLQSGHRFSPVPGVPRLGLISGSASSSEEP